MNYGCVVVPDYMPDHIEIQAKLVSPVMAEHVSQINNFAFAALLFQFEITYTEMIGCFFIAVLN